MTLKQFLIKQEVSKQNLSRLDLSASFHEGSQAKDFQNLKDVVCPESILESSKRHGFIRKAALQTAAAGLNSTIVEGTLSTIPESSADDLIGIRSNLESKRLTGHYSDEHFESGKKKM
jgi:hypothetical protein